MQHSDALLFGNGVGKRLLKLLELFGQGNDVELGFDLGSPVWLVRFCREGIVLWWSVPAHRWTFCFNLLHCRSGVQPLHLNGPSEHYFSATHPCLAASVVKSQYLIYCHEVFAEGIRDLDNSCRWVFESNARQAIMQRFPAISPRLEVWSQVPTDCVLSPRLVGKSKGKRKDREKAWYGILLLLTLMIWDTLALVWFVCRGIIRGKESWVFWEASLGVPSWVWGRVGHFCRSARLLRMKIDIYRNCPNNEYWYCSFTLLDYSNVVGAAGFTCFNFVRALWQSDPWYPESWSVIRGIWLSKFEGLCLFDLRTSNPIGCLALEIRRAMPLRFLNRWIC